jgi:hypothetical protein
MPIGCPILPHFGDTVPRISSGLLLSYHEPIPLEKELRILLEQAEIA